MSVSISCVSLKEGGILFCLFALGLAIAGVAEAQEPETLLPVEAEVDLFNGSDLEGWVYFSNDDSVEVESVWSVEDGVLKCAGKPQGYLQTKRWYRDYQLDVDWRWPAGKGGNSGVLIHTTTPLVFYGWPKSMEVQLQAKSAGDFWVICEGVDVKVADMEARRVKPRESDQHSHRRIRRLPGDFEKPIGEWNSMKVICKNNDIKVYVNGQLVNHGFESTVSEGAIALQSEGTPVEFRNIRLSPLEQESAKRPSGGN